MFQVNQIVKGARAGVFVILGFSMREGERYAALKEVNPQNHAEHGKGELSLPVSSLRPL